MFLRHATFTDGVILDQYGKRGTAFNINGIPTYSLPFKITDAPAGTVSFAIVLEDKDAIPVTNGFSWIHWVACNILKDSLQEDASQTDQTFLQGLNSWTSIQGGCQEKELSCFYGGMGAPDCPHIYELQAYALDCLLDLESGFYLNKMFHAMDGHILAQCSIKGRYDD